LLLGRPEDQTAEVGENTPSFEETVARLVDERAS